MRGFEIRFSRADCGGLSSCPVCEVFEEGGGDFFDRCGSGWIRVVSGCAFEHCKGAAVCIVVWRGDEVGLLDDACFPVGEVLYRLCCASSASIASRQSEATYYTAADPHGVCPVYHPYRLRVLVSLYIVTWGGNVRPLYNSF